MFAQVLTLSLPVYNLWTDKHAGVTEVWWRQGGEAEGSGCLAGWPLSQGLSGVTPLSMHRHRHILMTTGETTSHMMVFMGFTEQYTSVRDAD